MKLLNSQKNLLFDIIQNFELSPSQFEFQEVKSQLTTNEICTDLAYLNSSFYFSFESYSGQQPYYCIYSPGENVFKTELYTRNWESSVMEFQNWVSALEREITTVNKWDRLKLEMDNLKFSFTENDNNKFNVSEFTELSNKMKALKSGIISLNLPTEQFIVLNDKLDHLIAMGIEMNKYDWKNLFVGTIISIIIQLSISPENAKNLFSLIKNIFNSYLLP